MRYKKYLEELQDAINHHLTYLGTLYRIQLHWFDTQTEIRKVDSHTLELLKTIRPREPKSNTEMVLSGYLQALDDMLDIENLQEQMRGRQD